MLYCIMSYICIEINIYKKAFIQKLEYKSLFSRRFENLSLQLVSVVWRDYWKVSLRDWPVLKWVLGEMVEASYSLQ